MLKLNLQEMKQHIDDYDSDLYKVIIGENSPVVGKKLLKQEIKISFNGATTSIPVTGDTYEILKDAISRMLEV